ncbi:unnamed protein product, partial [Urochloa humidicola]
GTGQHRARLPPHPRTRSRSHSTASALPYRGGRNEHCSGSTAPPSTTACSGPRCESAKRCKGTWEGPGAETKPISLSVEDRDYMGRIKQLQEYLDKV